MKNKFIKKWLGIFICVFSFFVFNDVQAQVWQETLENQFDYVSTFDELENWRAIRNSVGDDNPLHQPKKIDGSISNWAAFTISDDADNKDDHIGDHGPEYNWRSNKSLTINPGTLYCDVDDEPLKGYGPDSMYYYFGDGTATSGYDDVYIFYMMKFYPGFFIKNDDGYMYGSVYKGFMANQGSTGGYSWNETGCNGSAEAYHPGFLLYNYGRYSPTQLIFLENISRAVDHNLWDPPVDCFAYEIWQDGLQLKSLDFTRSYENNEWIGIEIHYILGAENSLDGYVEIKMYNEQGVLIGSHESFNVGTNGERSTTKINRIHFGGNYQCNANSVQGLVTETRLSYDDLIIDDQQIAPTYFSLLNNQSIPETCTDNIQNQDETGIDCGGSCDACIIPTTYGLSNFISAITNWLGIGNTDSDTNNDGVVNTRDLGVMMSGWGN